MPHTGCRKKKASAAFRGKRLKKNPATRYSPMADRHSTIAAEALHFRVRNGNGCYLLAIVTGKNEIERVKNQQLAPW